MRTLLLITALSPVAACGGPGSPPPDLGLDELPATVTLAPGEARRVNGIRVRFESVTNDSRCPSDVVCVWAGNAEVVLSAEDAAGSPPIRVVLNSQIEPRVASAHGLSFTLASLAPTPVSTQPTEGYRAEIRITAP